jgi:hypothetical protein
MNVHKIKSPGFNYALFVKRKWFCIIRVNDVAPEMGDVALLRETFGAHNACTGRAEIFRVTSIVNGVANFTHVPAE